MAISSMKTETGCSITTSEECNRFATLEVMDIILVNGIYWYLVFSSVLLTLANLHGQMVSLLKCSNPMLCSLLGVSPNYSTNLEGCSSSSNSKGR